VFHRPFVYKKVIIARQEGYKQTRVISRPESSQGCHAIVQRIYDLFDHGAGYKQFAQILNQYGPPKYAARRWYLPEPRKRKQAEEVAVGEQGQPTDLGNRHSRSSLPCSVFDARLGEPA
jgi:hypothetical protein